MTQVEFLDAIRALVKEYGGYTFEGPDVAGDVFLRRQLNGAEKRRRGAVHFAHALRQIMERDGKDLPPAGFL